jgi:ketosteroid isomerase-like protein
MYRMIVAARTRRVWRSIDAHDVDAPFRMAADDMRFSFVGATPLGASFVGRDHFRAWLGGVFERFPDIRFDVRDVAVGGWPWRTRIAVRLGITATLADGSAYRNDAVQWITLRWGRMIDDWVLEDTLALDAACAVQSSTVQSSAVQSSALRLSASTRSDSA